MNSPLLFILPSLFIFSIVTSNEISIGETIHEQLTETSQYYTLSLSKSEISSKYLIFETTPTIYSNRASIFISQTEEHPSESGNTYSSFFFGKNKKCVSPVFGLTHGATQHNEFSVRILTQIFPKSQGEIPIVFRALAKKRRAAGERLSRSGTMAPSCRKARGTRGRTATPGCSSCR